jgi:peroxiredoxin Q/BCP
MTELEIGDTLPEFELQDERGRWVHSEDLKGRPLVIYFYPKDDTPGCTTQACGFRDDWEAFEGLNAQVYGVSRDGLRAHAKFISKYHLPFDLLSDPKNVLRKKFGVKGDLFGLIPGRATYVFDEKGILIHKYRSQRNALQHATEAKAALEKRP